jgi:HTH-type transcriptional regulator/antitoxin HigA
MREMMKIGQEIMDVMKVIKTEEEYKKALSVMDSLFDYTEGPWAKLADVLAVLIEQYEEEHYPIEDAKGVDVLRFLMEQNGLKQKDLVGVLGGKSTVSEIMNEKRPLNIKHANALAEMFYVSPATFV